MDFLYILGSLSHGIPNTKCVKLKQMLPYGIAFLYSVLRRGWLIGWLVNSKQIFRSQ